MTKFLWPQIGLFRIARSTVSFARLSNHVIEPAELAEEPRMRGSKKMRNTSTGALTAMALVLSAGVASADAVVPNHVRDVKMRASEAVPGGTEIDIVGTTAP